MRLAVLDIGSNTVHMLIFDVVRGARPVAYASQRFTMRLMRYLTHDGSINDEGLARLLDAVDSLMVMAREHEVDEILTIVTSAIREAVNGDEILAEIDARIDGDLQVLSGAEEAAATFLAARRWFGWVAGQLLVLDIGGGSLEIAAGVDEIPDVAESLPLGAGRLTRTYLHHDPPTKEELKELRTAVRAGLQPVAARVRESIDPDYVAATSKTFRSLARLAGMSLDSLGKNDRWQMSTSQLRDWVPRLAKIPAEQRMELPGITAERTFQIVAGAVVAVEVLQAFKIENVEICPWALREGALLRRLDQVE
ncbi:Ppx/GppA family phosphatase [Pseudactinotalea sp. HY160]|uniref:Ppx/GppA phosphatase family protein n=1 Tax=Pseudactinotalea sp. HY160 TaxID=2654490 RepID=UPI00128C6150|nr:Ppx/GppA family phosphatase [Pseudactinotalea sp. HY160]MPV49143.1 Ppx/GppA family phosphatase [Pseudactinotalea sp. HY160]